MATTSTGAAASSRQNSLNTFLSRSYSINWEVLVYLLILLLAIFTRFYQLGDRVMSHDESLHTRYSYNLYADGNFQHTPLMHGPVLFHATAFSYFLFGDNDFTSRIYPALLGIGIVMFPLLFRRWLGRWGAILAAVMFLISPVMLYYNRYIRHDTPSIFFALVMFYSILMYLNGPVDRRRKAYWLYIFAAAMVLNLGSKETSFIYIAIFGSFLTLYWLVRVLQDVRQIPGKAWFHTLIISILLGGLAALGMYVVLEIVPFGAASTAAQETGWFGNLESRSFVTWTGLVILSAAAVTIGPLLWAFRDRVARLPWRELMFVVLIALLVTGVLIFIEEASYVSTSADETAQPVVPGEEADVVTDTSSLRWTPLIGEWVVFGLLLSVILFSRRTDFWLWLHRFPEADILILTGTLILPWITAVVPYVMRGNTADYTAIAQSLPEFLSNAIPVTAPDQVGQVVVGFLAWLPLITLAIVVGLLWNWRHWLIASAVFHVLFAFFFTTIFTNIQGLATGMVYSLGYWLEQQGVRRGSQPQYYYLTVIMPFYEFLPVIGSFLAMIGGMVLFWRRKSQKLTLTSSIEATAEIDQPGGENADNSTTSLEELLADQQIENLVQEAKTKRAPEPLVRLPFVLFVAWWAVLNLVGYTLAGEKMPWLATHLTTPMIILTGWYFGRIVRRIDLARFLDRGWVYLVLVPLLFVTLVQAVGPFAVGPVPFSGLQQQQLEATYAWFAAVIISAGIIYALYRLVQYTGWVALRRMIAVSSFAVLGLITFRSAWMAAFINYDYATEYLVYAHAAPAIKTVLEELEELSVRTTDGNELRFAYDDKSSWPYSWYFRDFSNAVFVGSNPTIQSLDNTVAVVVGEANRSKVEPLLEDRYFRFEHMRLWWPMQDYFNLTADRVASTFDFAPDNLVAAQTRRGIFDIWWSRDYSTYGEAVGKNFNVTQWPVADRMFFYVRKDAAAQIWPYGIGEGTVNNPLTELTVNLCTANWVEHLPSVVFDTSTAPMNRPIGVAISPDDRVYVAEEFNYRISVFDTDGVFLTALGQQGVGDLEGAFFNRPSSVAIAPDGNLYVADTWNYQVKAFQPDGSFITRWGQSGEFGFDAKPEPVDAFWGPRDIVIDSSGQVYVSDTGNKRIRVYDENGEFLRDIGSGGSGPGQLDEPSGLALHPDGRLFVADTWNRRVSIFNSDGSFIDTFNVRGWYDELGNRPYLALDGERDMLYVTDPDGGRVLVYNTAGDCLGSFGQASDEIVRGDQFQTVGGIAIGSDGSVYVTDAGAGRLLKFPPFEAPALPETVDEAVDSAADVEGTAEVEPGAETTVDAVG